MAEYQFTKDANVSKLLEEIRESSIASKLQELRSNGEQIFVVTNIDLSAPEQTTLSGLIVNHTKTNDSATARDRVKRSILFGIDLISELGATFLKRNLPAADLLLVNNRFATFQQLIYAGYFELAKASLSQVTVDILVPQQVIDQLNTKMQRYIDAVKNG